LDNIIDELNKQIKNSDTVFLIHQPLDEKTLWRWQLNDIIISQIEKDNCAIIDANGNKQFTVIKVDGAWSSMPMTRRGGRRYYFSGNNDYFIDIMDWIQ